MENRWGNHAKSSVKLVLPYYLCSLTITNLAFNHGHDGHDKDDEGENRDDEWVSLEWVSGNYCNWQSEPVNIRVSCKFGENH